MKASICLALGLGCGHVLGGGNKGAAERVMWFADYIAEDVYEDESKRTIAVGCVGNRVTFRGKPDKCTFAEFLDHIWMETRLQVYGDDGNALPGRVPDERPNLENAETKMKKAGNLINTSVLQMSQAIMSYSEPAVKGGPNPKPAKTYLGNVKCDHLFADANMNDPHVYYDTLERSGAHRQATRNELDSLIASGALEEDKGWGKTMRKWTNAGQAAAEYGYHLRRKEQGDLELKSSFPTAPGGEQTSNTLRSYLGVDPIPGEWKPNSDGPLANLPKVQNGYKFASLPNTIDHYAPGADDATVQQWTERWNNALSNFDAQDNHAHRNAIKGAAANITPCGGVPVD